MFKSLQIKINIFRQNIAKSLNVKKLVMDCGLYFGDGISVLIGGKWQSNYN